MTNMDSRKKANNVELFENGRLVRAGVLTRSGAGACTSKKQD